MSSTQIVGVVLLVVGVAFSIALLVCNHHDREAIVRGTYDPDKSWMFTLVLVVFGIAVPTFFGSMVLMIFGVIE